MVRGFIDDLRAGVDHLQRAIAAANPAALEGTEAAEVVELCCAGKRACESGISLFSPRVQETGAFALSGHRSAPEWLAHEAGESPSRAKGRLDVGSHLAEMPALEAALRDGEVSAEQARVIATATSLDPTAAPSLLETAATESFDTLVHQAAAVKARALTDDAKARAARVHRRRYVRPTPEPGGGGVRGSFLFTDAAWGRCHSVLEPKAERIFEEGRASGAVPSLEAAWADALVAAVCSGGGSEKSGPGAMVHLRVDAESLRRGRTAGDEVCEIEGVGPVSVPEAKDLLGDCVFEVLVKDGCDVVNLTGLGRNIPTRLRTAVLRRDRHCRWPRCTTTAGTQIHHWRLDCRFGEVASLDTLVLLCHHHHDLCTYGGWRIEPNGDSWRPVPPVDPVGLDEVARRRRVTRRVAKARRAKARGRARDGPPGAASA